MSLSNTPTNALAIEVLGSLGLAGAEISAFDPGSNRLFVTSSAGLQVVDLSNPAAPALVTTIDFTTLGFATTDVTSVASKGGIVAVALPASPKTDPGHVVFLDAATGGLLGSVEVGSLPDMVTFTPDGMKVLTANEGEYASDGSDPAAGSVSIIDISGGVAAATVQTAGFTAFDGQEDALRASGVRIFAGKSVSQDVEPEYIAISADGAKAMVTLQEANAVAVLDIASATFTDIVPLGFKDFSTFFADFSDRDGPGNANLVKLVGGMPVFGMYMPDAIDSYQAGGSTYFVIANEGDDRDDFITPDETVRLGSLDLDNATFPNEAALKANAVLGRLTVTNAGVSGDTDGDGDIDRIQMLGGRSFSILDADGAIVFDSGDVIERIASHMVFNGPLALGDFDGRSDNKGPEPEGIEIGEIGGRIYVFVGLERANANLVFDITDPADVAYTGMVRRSGDVSPEGSLFISAADSPTGQALFVVSNEVSSTVSVFGIEDLGAEQPFTLQLLHFSDGEAGLLAGDTAPYLAALVDAFDDDYANTLILAGGDNFIPGPFLAAGTDPSVAATHNKGNNPGAADIEIHNRIGVEASTVGNHEFDLGTNAFSDIVNDAAFPYLTANLDFSADGALVGRYQETVGTGGLENAASLARKIVPSAVVSKGGELIGLVGATTQIVETISSLGGVEVKGFAGDGSEANDMALLASQLQIVIDDLRDQGVNKIVLMAHLQQIAFEQALAPLLEGVDIILAAGSNTRLGDGNDLAVDFPGHAANFAGSYPIVTAGLDGDTTLIVNTDNEFTYLGRLVVSFDSEGRIIPGSLDEGVSGATAATAANVATAWGVDEADLDTTAFADGTKGAAVRQITDAVDGVIQAKDGEVWGFTNVYLEGERNLVRNQETNLGNITADANLLAAQSALGDGVLVGSLKNGGGIRAQIGSVEVGSGDKEPPLANPDAGKPAGGVSTLDIENSLRFDNKLMVFDTTAAGLKAILEHGVALLGNQGRFPQIGGISFAYDPDADAGERISDLSVIDDSGAIVARLVQNGVVLPTAPATISMVTLNFLANGGDGYPMKANGANFRYLLDDGTLGPALDEALDFVAVAPANALGEQKAMKDFMQAVHGTPATAFDAADTAVGEDCRIANLDFLDGRSATGDDDAERLAGRAGDDSLAGAGGDDTLLGLFGADSLEGGEGDDRIIAGAGNDTALGGTGKDRILGEAGNDSLDGGGDDDILFGGAGNDAMLGGAGNDRLLAGAGNDSVQGGDGLDVLFGEAGADTLVGGGGVDLLLGGAGADLFRYLAFADSAATAPDRIIGFSAAEGDRIDLSELAADPLVFVTGAFLGGGLASVRVRQNTLDTILQVDDGSGGAPDMIIKLSGLHALGAGDLIL
ncbi:alkaline phosphatase [Falsiroseomonas bella]|uniref:Alkaline phosphatase n=1 Tax=Falsiroseomonas bella TaxID=2184016 RepID=A0A317FAJ2_9PROT|nr:choice-of-anchor I family protein [Falsiroseomonas bella]PWS35473.1 alkaline phosphatase [Falsiroseomonas bella]